MFFFKTIESFQQFNPFGNKIESDNSLTNIKQDCSYQGKALNVPTAFQGLWSIDKLKLLT